MRFTLVTYMHEEAPALELEPESELESALLRHLSQKHATFEIHYSGEGSIRLRGMIRQPKEPT